MKKYKNCVVIILFFRIVVTCKITLFLSSDNIGITIYFICRMLLFLGFVIKFQFFISVNYKLLGCISINRLHNQYIVYNLFSKAY